MTQKEMKYCSNCKFYSCIVTSWTSRKLWKERYCDPCRTIKNGEYDLDELEKCDELNSNNDCKLYQRIRWKFWK